MKKEISHTALTKLNRKAKKGELTLKEALENFQSTEVISIGSQTSYFFIAQKGELTEDKIKELDNQFKKSGIVSANAACESFNKVASKLGPSPKKLYSTPSDKRIKQIVAAYDYYSKLATLANDAIKKCRWGDGYTPLLERKVTSIFKREAENGIAIIVEGTESGSYWFEKDMKEKKSS